MSTLAFNGSFQGNPKPACSEVKLIEFIGIRSLVCLGMGCCVTVQS